MYDFSESNKSGFNSIEVINIFLQIKVLEVTKLGI
jgi:hypothetical protein